MGIGGEMYIACDGEETLVDYDGNACEGTTDDDVDIGCYELVTNAYNEVVRRALERGWVCYELGALDPPRRWLCRVCAAVLEAAKNEGGGVPVDKLMRAPIRTLEQQARVASIVAAVSRRND